MSDSENIFSNPKFQQSFQEKGFVIVDLLRNEQVDELISYYNTYAMVNDDSGFSATMHLKDSEKKDAISKQICSVLSIEIRKLAPSYSPLFGNFLIKKPKNKHQVGIHQDWNYVDESKFRSFNVWTSLSATSTENGGLWVLPGSHILREPVRYTPFEERIYKKFEKKIFKNSIGLSLKPGQAVFYDSSLIHFSKMNRTSEIRYATGCVCTPESATPIHYYKEGKNLICYKIDGEFFSKITPGIKPESEILEVLPFDDSEGLKQFDSFFSELKGGFFNFA